MNIKRIVISGGPSAGKTSIIRELEKQGHHCIPEISREIILEAQRKGIDQLFLHNPIKFSELLLEGRETQFLETHNTKHNISFFDRGIPDISAYMDYSNTEYPSIFTEKNQKHKYDTVFLLAPWKDIHVQDRERYEDFETAEEIFTYLNKTYRGLGYKVIEVPIGTVEERTLFILKEVNIL